MSLAIHQLLKHAPVSDEAIDRFIEKHDFPLLEGNLVTFIFRGQVERVNLQHWVYGLESSQAFQRVEETDLWYLVLDLPDESRIEYKFDIIHQGKRRWVHDPFNPHIARDPFGFNSVCLTQGYATPEWSYPDGDARAGTLEHFSLQSDAFGDERHFQVYLPARYRASRRYPLLIIHDGPDYLRYASLQHILDNMIHRQEIPPLIAVLTHANDRLREYAADERHARFIAEELLGFVTQRFPIHHQISQRCIMGASFGAVASLFTAWKYQGHFGRLLLQSGSFAFTDIGKHKRGPAFDPIVPFINAFRDQPGKPAEKLFVSCGTYESLIYENRSLVPLLQSSGMMVRYVEARDGHNWENWRDRLREGLSWLFPGPLWMIYE